MECSIETRSEEKGTEEIITIIKSLSSEISIGELAVINLLIKCSGCQVEAYSNVFSFGVAKGRGII